MLRSILQNSTAGFYIFASDSATPTSGKTGLTITATLSKAGGTANSVSPTYSEIGNGLYWVAPIAAHRDTLGEIAWQFSGTGAIIAPRLEKVVAVNDQTARFGASDGTGVTLAADQEVNTTKWGGTAVASANVLIDGAITAAKIATDAITAEKVASDAVTEIQSGLASQTSVDTLASYVDTEVAAIKARTDNLPADPAVASDIAASFSSIASSIATLTAYVDTEVAAIKAKTDNLPTDPADQSAVEAAITAAASLLATAAELAKVPKVGSTHRYTQVASDSNLKTADVLIGEAV